MTIRAILIYFAAAWTAAADLSAGMITFYPVFFDCEGSRYVAWIGGVREDDASSVRFSPVVISQVDDAGGSISSDAKLQCGGEPPQFSVLVPSGESIPVSGTAVYVFHREGHRLVRVEERFFPELLLSLSDAEAAALLSAFVLDGKVESKDDKKKR